MLKVLIVDDEPSIRARLRKMIPWDDLGLIVAGEASDGEEGYDLALSLKPNIIITDIRMPVYSGLELVGKVKNVVSDIKFIIISGYNDFNYAKTALKFGVKDYLLKPVDEKELTALLSRIKDETEQELKLVSSIDEARKFTKQAMLSNMINNHRPPQPEQVQELFGKQSKTRCLGVMIVEIDNLLSDAYEDEELSASKDRLLSVIENWSFFNSESKCLGLDERNDRFTVIVPVDEDTNMIGFHAEADRLREHILQNCGVTVTIGIGGIESDPKDIPGLYQMAKTAVEGKFILGNNRIITLAEIMQLNKEFSWGALANLDRSALLEAIEYHNTDLILEKCALMFQLFKDESVAPHLIESILIENLVGIGRMIAKKNGDVTQIVGDHFRIDRLFQRLAFSEIEHWFLKICLKVADYMQQLRQGRIRRVSDKIIELIHERLHEEITLKSLAATVYMNPVYLGQVFKNETGSTFNEYLTEVRIKKAITLLADTDLHIYEIAEQVGYGAPNQFYASFKRKMGCNPSEYRVRIRGS